MSLDSSSFLLIMTAEGDDARLARVVGPLTHAENLPPLPMPSATIAKNWVLGTRSIEFEATYTLPVGGLSSLIDGCARLLDAQISIGEGAKELRDLKGRDPHDIVMPGLATARTDEILRVGGSIAVGKKGSDFEWEPFEAICYTPFSRFEGAHHIVFSTTTERTHALPTWLPLRLLGSAAPIKPTFFRYGLQHFRSRMTFASLGYTPQVTESVLLDGVSDTLMIKMTCEVRRSESPDPFSSVEAYTRLFSVIDHVTGRNVLDDYRTEVESLKR